MVEKLNCWTLHQNSLRLWRLKRKSLDLHNTKRQLLSLGTRIVRDLQTRHNSNTRIHRHPHPHTHTHTHTHTRIHSVFEDLDNACSFRSGINYNTIYTTHARKLFLNKKREKWQWPERSTCWGVNSKEDPLYQIAYVMCTITYMCTQGLGRVSRNKLKCGVDKQKPTRYHFL